MAPSWQRPEVTLAPSPRGEDLSLARELGIPLATALDATEWQIVRTAIAMELRSPAATGGSIVEFGLSSGPIGKRLRTSRPDEPLLRAIGLPRRQEPPRVVDATAGLCRDALVMAHHGCTVLAVERVAAFVFLVRAAIEGSTVVRRLEVHCADGAAWLAACPTDRRPDVVYLDPMFSDEGRAQVKKDSQALRALAGPPTDTAALFAAACTAARERVVCKRHPGSEPIGGRPSFAIDGERVRFDVYLTGKPAQ